MMSRSALARHSFSPVRSGSGAKALRAAIDAKMKGISLEEAAKTCPN
jgi:ribulose 1,5-bisphosphate carboxylase large subunit-like protein